MSKIEISEYTTEGRDDLINTVKDFLIASLCNEEVITEEVAIKYISNYKVLARRPGFFSKIFKKETEEKIRFYLVENKSGDEQ